MKVGETAPEQQASSAGRGSPRRTWAACSMSRDAAARERDEARAHAERRAVAAADRQGDARVVVDHGDGDHRREDREDEREDDHDLRVLLPEPVEDALRAAGSAEGAGRGAGAASSSSSLARSTASRTSVAMGPWRG